MNTYKTEGPTTDIIGAKVRKLLRVDRPSPFLVQWGRGTETKTESFKTSEERDQRYEEIRREQNIGREDRVFSSAELNEYAAIKAAIGDANWIDVVSGWREHLIKTGRLSSRRTISEAAEEYIKEAEALLNEGKLARDTFRQKRHKLREFASKFEASRRMVDVTADEITDWINSSGSRNPSTFNSYLKHIRAFYNANKKHVPSSPADEVPMKDDSVEEVGIITPKEAAKLFGFALKNKPDAIGRLALEAFAGLRFGSADKLSKEDINFAEKGIMLPKYKVKTRRRFYLDGLPDNLWDWMDLVTDACWQMEKNDWMHMKSRLFAGACVPHPRNCLRHSFCTYHVSAYKNPGRTATILCHQNQTQLWGHYHGIASQAAGLTYFSITPENVEQIAAG